MKWMLKNSAGRKDSMLTFAVVGFVATILAIFVSMVESMSVGEWSLELRPADATIVTAMLAASLVAYVNRRNTKDKLEHELRMSQAKKVNNRKNNNNRR